MKARSLALLLAASWWTAGCLPAEWGAGAILHPWRRPIDVQPDIAYQDMAFRTDDGLLLRGWLFRATAPNLGLIVYLHGIGDNRQSGIGVARRLNPRGFDVLAFDARAHGQSEGTVCTYGFLEKRDVLRALDAVHAEAAILFGSSLGASIALQAAPLDPRVRGVVAQSPFSDLATIVQERAPFIATHGDLRDALALAEARGGFRTAEVSPRDAAVRIRVPVLLIHGGRDRETSPDHSRRVYAALGGPRRLLILPGAGHNDVLGQEEAWQVIADWLTAPAGAAYAYGLGLHPLQP